MLFPALTTVALLLLLGVVIRMRRYQSRAEDTSKRLEASERRYRMLFENNPYPMWVFDEGTLAFLDVNPSAIAHYGYTREEFLSMTLADIRPVEDVPNLLNDIGRKQNTRHSDGPWRHRRRDGSVISVEITTVPIDGFGRPAKFVVAADVTARIEAEAALRRSEEQHRVIIEAASDAILTIDEESKILFASAPVERIFGYRPEELVGKPLTMLIPEPLRAAHLRGFRRYLETGQRHISWQLVELPGSHKNGSEVPVELSFGEFRSGSRRWFTGVIRDVSERRRAEESLRESRELIQTVFNTVPLAIWGIDRLGRVGFWNHAAEALFGWTEQEVLGQDLPIIPEEQQPEFAEWLSAYAVGQKHVAIERKRRRKRGTSIDCEIWTAPLRSAAGAITGTVGILANVTERKHAEEELAKHVRRLARSNADLQQFAWAASHDLLEPIRMVTLNTQLFERRFGGVVPEEGRQYLEYAREGAFRMKELVDALRDYWEIQHRTLELKTVSLAAAIRSARAALPAATVTWDDLPSIAADEGLVTRLLRELLENAVKFRSGEPPAVHVSAQKTEDCWTVLVKDNGVGIESAYVESVFLIFRRLSRDRPGVGIGLSLCKQIMERHNGRIWLASQPGAGTTIHLQFSCEPTGYESHSAPANMEAVRKGVSRSTG